MGLTVGNVYVVQVYMSSPYRIAESEFLDEDTLKIRYLYPREVRRKIESIRNRYKRQIYEKHGSLLRIATCRR
ncbi:MAG TPA: hypothetical protein ENG16_00925 [Archaeoglobus sp.]|nr:hypothetical protein [Archaeoglobus sp.]